MCGRTQGASTIQLYINDNAFMCTHLGCVPTFLAVILIINKKRGAGKNTYPSPFDMGDVL